MFFSLNTKKDNEFHLYFYFYFIFLNMEYRVFATNKNMYKIKRKSKYISLFRFLFPHSLFPIYSSNTCLEKL